MQQSILRIVLLPLFAHLLLGQTTTAELTGRVTDHTQAVISGALINVTNLDSGIQRSSPSNDTGNFTVPFLAPGNYRIDVQKDGFQQIVQSGIKLQVNQVARIDFVLEVGSSVQEVNVVASAPLLDRETATMGTVMDNIKIVNLPVNARNPFALALLVPGFVPSTTFGAEFNTAGQFRINGGLPNMSDILIDGVSNAQPGSNQFLITAVFPSIDALEEFKVLTNGLPAEYGHTGGGIVNMMLKSGTNRFHGTAYDFLRNNKMDANGFFSNQHGTPLPSFQRNQFGGTFGGPIIRNKMFFFVSHEQLRQGSVSSISTTVPTDLEKHGDFSQSRQRVSGACVPVQLFDPVTTSPSGNAFSRSLFPNNVIPTSRIDAVGSRIAQYYPNPNVAGDSCTNLNNFFSAQKAVLAARETDAKVDWSPTLKDKFFGSVSARDRNNVVPAAYRTAGSPGSSPNGDLEPGKSMRLDYTRVQTPTFLVNFRFGISRSGRQTPATVPKGFQMTDLGFPKSLQDQMVGPPAFPAVAIAGFGNFGQQFSVVNQEFTSYSWNLNATRIAGKHTFKFGAEVRLNQDYAGNLDYSQGNYTFDRGFTQGPDPNAPRADRGSGLASALLGLGNGYVKIKPTVLTSNNYYSLYIQDDFRVSSRLTLNLGLRYDLENGRTERYNKLSWFDFTAPSPLGAVPGFPNLIGGLRFLGKDANRQFNLDPTNFGPRAGLAFTLTPRTTIRMAYGLIYMSFLGAAAGDAAGTAGFTSVTQWVSSLDGLRPLNYLSNAYPSGLIQPTGSSLGLMTLVGQSLTSDKDAATDRTSRPAYDQQWNVNLQRQVSDTVSVEVAYVGNKGTRLIDSGWAMNQLTSQQLLLGTALQQLVPNPFYGIVTSGGILSQPTVTRAQLLVRYPQFTGVYDYRPGAASSIYHALQVGAQKRFSGGSTFQLSYTNGKLIDDSAGIIGGTLPEHQNAYNRRADRSVSPQDVSQRLVMSYIYDLPFGRKRRFGGNIPRWADLVAGNWRLNGITTLSTGLPLALTAPNNSGSGSAVQRPNVNGDPNLPGGRSTADQLAAWFNTSAFSQPAAFTFGNVGRTLPNVRSDGLTNFDLSCFKEFPIRETLRAEFRGEFFNAFNTPQFGSPGLPLGGAGFGVISSQANSPRQVQLALKVIF